MARTDKERQRLRRQRREQEERKQEKRKQERREFKAKAFLTPGSENPHAKKFERTGKARHRPPINAMEAGMRKQFLAIYDGDKGKAANMAEALFRGHPDGRSGQPTGGIGGTTQQLMIDKKKRKKR